MIRNATIKYRTCAQFTNRCEVDGIQYRIPKFPEVSDDEANNGQSPSLRASRVQLAFIRTKVTEPLRSLACHDADASPTSGHMLPFFNMPVSLAQSGNYASFKGNKRKRGINLD